MHLTTEQLSEIKSQFRASDEWSTFKAYLDWRISGDHARAAEVAERFAERLAAIAGQPVHDDPSFLQRIVDELYDEELDRLKRGMEPVPHEETDLEGAVAYLAEKGWLRPHEQGLAREHLSKLISKLMEGAQPGDRLFICKSRYIGPLAGHEGLGLVRDDEVIRYETLINY